MRRTKLSNVEKFQPTQWVEVFDVEARKWFAGVVDRRIQETPPIYQVTGFDGEGEFCNTWDEDLIRDRTFSVGL